MQRATRGEKSLAHLGKGLGAGMPRLILLRLIGSGGCVFLSMCEFGC